MTDTTPPPAAGQIWQDNDPRGDGRTIRIVEIDGSYAVVQSVHPHLHRPGRRTRIRLDRLRPTRNGYRYVGHPEDTDPSPLTEQQLADIADHYAVYQRRHGPTGITCCSAHPVADAVPELLDEVRRLRTANERMRHELEVMYGGAFDKLPEPAAVSAAVAPPTNPTAVRHEADWIVEHCPDHGCVEPSTEVCHCEIADRLRRMADEAQPATEAEAIRREHVDYFLQCRQPDGTWEQASSYETDPDRAQERLARIREQRPGFTWRLARRSTTVTVEVQQPAEA